MRTTTASPATKSVRLIITRAAVDGDGKRVFEGIASTPSTDSMDDIVQPEGAQYRLPLPLLWQHRADQPAVGRVFEASKSPAGIRVKAEIERVDEPGTLKDRLDEAWSAVKKKLVALSIGFLPDPAHTEKLPGGGLWFRKWKWLELSLVTLPANVDAQILLVAAGQRSTASQRAGLPAGSRPLNFPPPPPRLISPKRRSDGCTSTAPPMFERRDDGAVQLRIPRRRGRGRPLLDREPASGLEGARYVMPRRPSPGRKITLPSGSRRL